jgi:hypothetical protein
MHVLLWESVCLLGHYVHKAALAGLLDLSEYKVLSVCMCVCVYACMRVCMYACVRAFTATTTYPL